MTDKRSQIVLPINPITLFTTIVGGIIMAVLAYLATEASKWSDAAIGVQDIQHKLEEQKQIDLGQNAALNDHGKRIQSIEETRFKREDAEQLKKDIVGSISKEMEAVLQPVVDRGMRNERDIQKIELDIETMKYRTHEK